MNPIITLTGDDAVAVGLAANRQPEVLRGTSWKHASSISEARRASRVEPASVRLRASARNLIEDVTKKALPVDADLGSAINDALPDCGIVEDKALNIIKAYV